MLLSNLKVSINCLTVLSLLLPNLAAVQDFLSGLLLHATTSRVVIVDLVNEVRGVLLGDSECLTEHLVFLVHADGFLRLFGGQIALLSFREVVLLLVGLGLLKLDACHAFRMVLASDLNGGVPVAFVLVHVDGFLRLVRFDELLLGLLEPVIVFKMQGVLEMNVWQLVAGVVLSKLEGIVKLLLVSLKVDCSFNETIFDEELGSTISTHALGNLNGNFSKLFLNSVGLSNTKCFPIYVLMMLLGLFLVSLCVCSCCTISGTYPYLIYLLA